MNPELIERFTEAILSRVRELERNRDASARSLWRSALALEHLVLSDLLSAEEEDRVVASLSPATIQSAQSIMGRLETTIERSFADLALGGGGDAILRAEGISENYLVRYEELARGEIELARLGPQDRVLFIGSGPFPVTAIEYHRQSGCVVDCVDFVEEAVETSRRVVERLGLRHALRVHRARGEEFPASAYSVVLVGVLARPKPAIFQNLALTSVPGCRVLARTTFGLRQLIYGQAADEELRRPELEGSGQRRAFGDQVLSTERMFRRS